MAKPNPNPKDAPASAKEATSHEVVLLGKKYRLKSPHDERYLAELANYVTAQVAEVQRRGAASTLDAALLAALNIADEMNRLKRDAEARLAEVGEKTQALLAALEEQDATAPADAPADPDDDDSVSDVPKAESA